VRLQTLLRPALISRERRDGTYLLTRTSGLLHQVHEHRADAFAGLADLDEICAKALEIAASSSLSVNLNLLKSAVIVLRLIPKTSGRINRVREMLAEHEERIFVAFQRNVEANRSLGFSGSSKQLRLVVIDTHFGAQEVLFNSLVSGFAAINRQLKRESRVRKSCTVTHGQGRLRRAPLCRAKH
jgi:hypothetical protein